MPDDDTLVFTEADVTELRALLDHTCTPRWWPHRVGETCTCDCGHRWVCCDYAGTLGWRTTA